jgi:quercetin dioxygenase-like cupin family protein
MRIEKLKDMQGGWFVGNFTPTAHKADFEVCYKFHPKGDVWDIHYHDTVTEINLLVRGKMRMQNRLLEAGDIFIIEPYEISDPEFLEDCEVVVVKTPSANDKIPVKKI